MLNAGDDNSHLTREKAGDDLRDHPVGRIFLLLPPLRSLNGSTAIDGRSRAYSAALVALIVRRSRPDETKTLAGQVRIRRCVSPLSPTALRAALIRLFSSIPRRSGRPQGVQQVVLGDDAGRGCGSDIPTGQTPAAQRDRFAASPQFATSTSSTWSVNDTPSGRPLGHLGR